MADIKHIGRFEECSYCLKYIRLGYDFGDYKGYKATTRKLHRIAIKRQQIKALEMEEK